MKLLWTRSLLPAAVLAGLILANRSPAVAPPVEERIVLPSAFSKIAPEGLADLKAMQDQVKAVLKKAMPATVAIIIPDPFGRGVAAGSGVIISEDGYVLTAGHISQKPKQRCQLILPDGKRLAGETLGWNRARDAGLIKITDKGKFPFVKMGDSAKLKTGDWCLTVGHPGGYKPGRAPVVRLGRVLSSNRTWVQTDTPLVGGDSGGPLFDMAGRVIGIHSWISQSINGNMHVPVSVYRNDWERLVKAEDWGGAEPRPQSSAYLGVSFDRESEDLVVTDVGPRTPAGRAGIQKGDVLVRIDSTRLSSRGDLHSYMQKKKPGEEITLVVRRDGRPITTRLKLGNWPAE